MPENTIYVGRPSKWGNPYSLGIHCLTMTKLLKWYREFVEYQLTLHPEWLDALKGKDLACWCPLDQPCHADILLEFLKNVR